MIFLILGIILISSIGVYAYTQQPDKRLTPELEKLINSKALAWSLSPALVKAVARAESGFDILAQNPSDPSYGLLQITPGLAYDYGLIVDYRSPSDYEIGKIYNVSNNLDVACWFMKRLHSKYTFDEAVQMYNVGETGYKKGVRNLAYLKKIKGYYELYKT